MIHINLNMILYTHVEHSPTKTIYIKYDKTIQIFDTQNMQNVLDVFGDFFIYKICKKKHTVRNQNFQINLFQDAQKLPFITGIMESDLLPE